MAAIGMAPRIVVDESMPHLTALELRRVGHWAEDVQDYGG